MKPNILIITIDSARADRFSCYFYSKPTTPFLEKFAEDAVIFETAISPAGWTLPSMSSIFSGIYPSKHGKTQYLYDKYPLLSQVLKDEGYVTSVFSNNPYYSPNTGFGRGVDYFFYYNRRIAYKVLSPVVILKYLLRKGRHLSSYMLNEQAKRFLLANRKTQPIYLSIHLGVHYPYQSPKKFRTPFVDPDMPERKIKKVMHTQDVYRYLNGDITQLTKRILNMLYDGMTAYTDSLIESIVYFLKDLNLLDNTMIIITADHGDALGENGLFFHRVGLYENLIRVPLIIRYPEKFQPGERIRSLVQTIDLYPTILDCIGSNREDIRRELQGVSLLNLKKDPRKFTISERRDFTPESIRTFRSMCPNFDIDAHNHQLIALRTDRFKYIWSSKKRHALYDLENDPGELHNLINQKVDIAKDLDDKVRFWLKSFKVEDQDSHYEPEFDESMKRQLRSLGYVD